MQKSRKVPPFEKRLRLLEEALEQMKQKMDETDREGLVCAFLERTQVGRAAIVAGLSR